MVKSVEWYLDFMDIIKLAKLCQVKLEVFTNIFCSNSYEQTVHIHIYLHK